MTRFIPLIVFLAFCLLMALPLLRGEEPARPSSALTGRAAPALDLPPVLADVPGIHSDSFQRAGAVVNIFASWCVSCRAEHATLTRISAEHAIPVYGIAYRDTPENIREFLEQHGNPYAAIGLDDKGLTAPEWGVTGVPETFVVNKEGIVIYKHAGPVTEKVYKSNLKPVLQEMAP